jgi:hypothetical protein
VRNSIALKTRIDLQKYRTKLKALCREITNQGTLKMVRVATEEIKECDDQKQFNFHWSTLQ